MEVEIDSSGPGVSWMFVKLRRLREDDYGAASVTALVLRGRYAGETHDTTKLRDQ